MMISAMCAVLAATQVFRLELTNETPYLVGADGVKREVCLVDPTEYAMLTGQVAKVWESLNGNENGRMSLHGKRLNQTIDTTNGVKVTTYADGYRHTEKMVKRDPAKDARRAEMKPKKISELSRVMRSERHEKFRAAMAEHRKRIREGKAKEVTVEHDAATGTDEVK